MRGILGSGKRDVHEIEILDRNLTWTEEGLEYEGSDKHRRGLLEGLGLNEESKTVNSAAVKPKEIGQEEDTGMLNVAETKMFRSLAATLNYMSLDRSDVQYAAKEVCTKMASPTQGSWKRLKKAGRYLKGVEKVTWVRSWKSDDEVNVDVHVDSDWAKGPERKSTSGGTMMINGTVVKHGSRTQATRALEHGGSRVLRGDHGCSLRPWNAVDGGRPGSERAGTGLEGLQRCQSDRVETRSWKDPAH